MNEARLPLSMLPRSITSYFLPPQYTSANANQFCPMRSSDEIAGAILSATCFALFRAVSVGVNIRRCARRYPFMKKKLFSDKDKTNDTPILIRPILGHSPLASTRIGIFWRATLVRTKHLDTLFIFFSGHPKTGESGAYHKEPCT